MRKLNSTEQTIFNLLMLPLQVSASGLKAEWRRQRNNSLEELGLPPMKESK